MLEMIDLHCEYAVNPIGIDVRQPRLVSSSSPPGAGAPTRYQLAVAASGYDDLQAERWLYHARLRPNCPPCLCRLPLAAWQR